MRPVRLLLDGFGSYREPADVDFSGVEFFALVGPTGSGKSTVIDGLCFALYGTVPRWGKENVISQALAPAANACRVALVFEASGKRYGVVRALTRDKKGQVHTKAARLERLDPSVPADAPLDDLLAASIEHLAERPDEIKAQVQEILGLTYEHFTQSVLLPQGRFSEFLHAKPADRQDLLVELLAFGIYNRVGRLARRRAELASERLATAQSARNGLAGASEDAESRATGRLRELAELASDVETGLATLREQTMQAEHAAEQAQAARGEAELLAAVRTPAEVSGLAMRIARADSTVIERKSRQDAADAGEVEAKDVRDALPALALTEALAASYAERNELTARLAGQQSALAARRAELTARKAELDAAELKLDRARQACSDAERAHAAAALAEILAVGADCPVCLRPVTSLPHHPVPPGLAEARAAADWAGTELKQVSAAHEQAGRRTAVAERDVEDTKQQVGRLSAQLADAPAEAEVTAKLEAIGQADEKLGLAQGAARQARQALAAAVKDRESLNRDERRVRAALGAARDSVVGFGAPAADDRDLAGAWAALTGWAMARSDELGARQAELDAAAASLRQRVTQAGAALGGLLAAKGITGVTDPARCEAAVATHLERAANHLTAIRAERRKAAELDEEIRAHQEDGQVATMLGRLLRANKFEGWLCGEALDSLVAEASQTLMELSAGQYQLDRDERNELVVIDYQDAGATRPVHTLSGGETFQASLALALALSRQVVGLSGGLRDLNSMFLDEGFGTLDEDTLETVGATLERLSADSDRMIGIITHVAALAERARVRFIVSRAGTTSTLRREGAA